MHLATNLLFYITPAPPSLTSGPAAGTGAAAAQKNSSLCPIPGCNKPRYVDPSSGATLDYCGKSHADEGKRRGIRRKRSGTIVSRARVYLAACHDCLCLKFSTSR